MPLATAAIVGTAMVPCFVQMRCGNCRRAVRECYEVPEAPPEQMQHQLDAGSIRVWGGFICPGCAYDKAYVLAFGRS